MQIRTPYCNKGGGGHNHQKTETFQRQPLGCKGEKKQATQKIKLTNQVIYVHLRNRVTTLHWPACCLQQYSHKMRGSTITWKPQKYQHTTRVVGDRRWYWNDKNTNQQNFLVDHNTGKPGSFEQITKHMPAPDWDIQVMKGSDSLSLNKYHNTASQPGSGTKQMVQEGCKTDRTTKQ